MDYWQREHGGKICECSTSARTMALIQGYNSAQVSAILVTRLQIHSVTKTVIPVCWKRETALIEVIQTTLTDSTARRQSGSLGYHMGQLTKATQYQTFPVKSFHKICHVHCHHHLMWWLWRCFHVYSPKYRGSTELSEIEYLLFLSWLLLFFVGTKSCSILEDSMCHSCLPSS